MARVRTAGHDDADVEQLRDFRRARVIQGADVHGVAADVAVAGELAGDAPRDARRARANDVTLVVEEHEVEVALRADGERRILACLDAARTSSRSGAAGPTGS